MHTIGAFAIIDSGGKVLLCHRTDRDAWNLPGGRVEAAETPWAAVVREVEEEVGLLVKVIGAIFMLYQCDRTWCLHSAVKSLGVACTRRKKQTKSSGICPRSCPSTRFRVMSNASMTPTLGAARFC
ncbi:MAG: NUDIX domain-containing protein [Oscillatoriales cyanobacterium]|nr:MAG: NUDIX domain-containing protein [Oscillatoriales cyanobacterium]